MNKISKLCKRTMAIFLAALMLLSAGNFGFAFKASAASADSATSVTLGELIANNYADLSKEEKNIITSGGLLGDIVLKYVAPPAEADDENKLVVVDEDAKTVTVKTFTDDEGNLWLPVSFDMTVSGVAISGHDDLALTKDGDVYVGSYTHDVNMFSVVVTYVLDTDNMKHELTADEQLALLNAAYYLAQDVDYMQMLNSDICASVGGNDVAALGVLAAMTATGLLDSYLPASMAGMTGVDLLAMLAEGYGETVTMPDDSEEEIYIELYDDAADAAKSLKQQQDANEKLDLDKFFGDHTEDGYLEILDLYSADLETALSGNYAEIVVLAGDDGLKDVEYQLKALLRRMDGWREDAYGAINDKLDAFHAAMSSIEMPEGVEFELQTQLPPEVNSVAELEALIVTLGELKAELQAALPDLNDALKTLDDAKKQIQDGLTEGFATVDGYVETYKLADYGITSIKNEAELNTAINTLQSKYKEALEEINKVLTDNDYDEIENAADLKAVLDEAIADANEMLTNNGINKTITGSADLQDIYEEKKDEYNAAIDEINAKLHEHDEFQDKNVDHSDDLAALLKAFADTKAETYGAIQSNGMLAAMAQSPTYAHLTPPSQVDTVAELEGWVEALQPMKAVPAYETMVKDLETACDGLAMIEELEPTVQSIYDQMVVGEGYLADLKTAYETMEKMEQAYDLLTMAETAKDGLDEFKKLVGDANSTLAEIDETVATIKSVKSTVEDAVDEIDPAIGMIHTAIDALNLLDEKEAELVAMKSGMSMLIGVLENFCATVEPVVQRFENNEWKTAGILADGADYDKIEDNLPAFADAKLYTNADVIGNLKVATAQVKYDMSMYDVTILVQAEIIELVEGENTVKVLTEFPLTVTLREGAGKDEIQPFIDDLVDTALEAWEVIDDDHYLCTTSDLDGLLEGGLLMSDIEYTVKYTPKPIKITLDEGFDEDEISLPYGWTYTLERHETAGKAYSYTVDGKKMNEGKTVVIEKPITISRTEGDATQYKSVVDLIVNTGVASGVNSFIQSPALDQGNTFWLVSPRDEDNLIDQKTVYADYTVKAATLDSELAGLVWVPVSATTYNEAGAAVETVPFNGGEAVVTDPAYTSISVQYQLQLTVAALESVGITADEVLAKMNLQDTLAKEYKAQKAALEQLMTQMANMAKISANKGALNTAQNLNGVKPESKAVINSIMVQLDEVEAATGAENLWLYHYLTQIDTNGDGKADNMLYYYQNFGSIIAQVDFVLNMITVIENDPALKQALVDNNAWEMFEKLKAQFQGLELNAPHGDILQSAGNANLATLVGNIEKAVGSTTVYTADALNTLTWSATVNAAGAGSANIPITLTVVGKGTMNSSVSLKLGVALTDQNIAAMQSKIDALVADFEARYGEIDTVYYVCSQSLLSVGQTLDGTEAITITWTEKTFDVEVPGVDDPFEVTKNDREVTLPGTGDANVGYTYVITYVDAEGGEQTIKQPVSIDNQHYTLPEAVVEALNSGRSVTIDREVVDVARDKLIGFVDEMGGVLLEKDANGKYTVILSEDALTSFVMAVIMDAEYSTIYMGGNSDADIFKANNQLHLQTLINVIMNSGLGTESLQGQYPNLTVNEGDIINNVAITGTKQYNAVISTDLYLDTLGANFHIALSDATLDMLRSYLASAEAYGVTIECANGALTAAVDFDKIHEDAYLAYLAALSMVGQVDLRNLDAVNAEIALGYLLTLLQPVLGNDEVTIDTITNTLDQLGKSADLSAYEAVFGYAQAAYAMIMEKISYEGDTASVTLADFAIDSLVARLQPMIDDMLVSMGQQAGMINLADLIYECDDPSDDSDVVGIDLAVAIKMANIGKDFDVFYLEPKAEGVANKLGLIKHEDLNLTATGVVVLVGDVEGDLVFNSTILLDLNGFTVNGSIIGNNGADVFVVDSDYTAENGYVTGAVSGNVSVLGGKYAAALTEDVLGEGYKQNADGTVGNKLFTVTETDSVITVTLNATPKDVAALMSQRGVIELAAEVLTDLVINHYNAASLAMDGNTIFNIQLADLLGLLSADGSELAETALGCISAPDLANVFNAIVADLTNYTKMATALADGGDGIISSHDFTTATWALEVEHVTDGDALTVNLGAADTTKTKTFQIVVDGEMKSDLAILTAALADTVKVESKLTMADLVLNNGKLTVAGEYAGSVVVDFAKDPAYVIALAVILADGTTDSALVADLVAGIEAYVETGDLYELSIVFKTISVKNFCDALRNHSKDFEAMVDALALSADAKTAVKAAVDNNEKGYALLVDVAAIALKKLDEMEIGESITGSGRTLGSFEKTDDADKKYFGFEKDGSISGTYSVLDVNMEITNVSVKLYMFKDHTCVDEDKDHYCDIGCGTEFGTCEDADFDHDCDYGCDKVFGTCEDADFDHDCDYGCDKVFGTCEDADFDHDCDYGCDKVFGTCEDADFDHDCDYGCDKVFGTCEDADKDHDCDYGCDKVFGTCEDTDFDHDCDYGCDKVFGTCEDADKDHDCDYGCDKIFGTCEDADKDHDCDYGCDKVFGECADNDGDGKCDYGCGKDFHKDPVVYVPTISVGGDIFGFQVDENAGILFVDTVDEGLTVEQFKALLQVRMDHDADGKCAITVTLPETSDSLIATGTTVTVTAENAIGVIDTATYKIVVMGDTNCNGRIDSGDAVKVANHYYGDAELAGLVFLAGDTNCNGRIESGDAVKINTKYNNAGSYITGLTTEEQ